LPVVTAVQSNEPAPSTPAIVPMYSREVTSVFTGVDDWFVVTAAAFGA
jgi:hypothetical protein